MNLRKMEELTDQFLQGLTPAEIAEIVDQLDELDPDNALLAAGYRQSNQTEKKETGAFDREALLEYLEEHARSIPDKEDYVPYVPGQKRGKIFKKEMPKQTYSALEPDIEDALKDIDGADLSELAEILGEATIQSDQFLADINSHVELGAKGYSMGEDAGLKRIYRPDYRDPIVKPDEPELNPADIEEDLRRVQNQDETMTIVNWNNLRDTPITTIQALFSALEYNRYVREVSIANTRANDTVALSIIKCLEDNTVLEKLNVESNFISAKPMQELVHQSCQSKTLSELRIDNQRNKYGETTENLFCDSLLNGAGVVTKFGYSWKCPGPRSRSQHILMKNFDKSTRQKRQNNS